MSLVIDEEINNYNLPYHIEYLSKSLKKKKRDYEVYELSNQKIKNIKTRIDELIQGNIYFDESDNIFKFKTSNESYSMKNTASGIKQFGVIPLLLETDN